MFGLQIADVIFIGIYFVGITFLGIWTARMVKSTSDFFMPRRFGKWMLIMHSFGSGTHSDQAVSVASKTFVSGLSGIWYQWLWLFVTPFFWLIAPIMRRFRAITTADVFEARYNKSVAVLFAIVGIIQLMVTIGVMLKGSGAILSATFNETIHPDVAIAVITVLFVVYGMAGGLGAAIITDFIQGVLTIIFSFLLLPFVMNAVGGMSGLHQQITDERLFSIIAPEEIGVFYVAVIAINGLFGIVTQPHIMGLCSAGKDEMAGRMGFTFGNYIKSICTIAWTLTGFAAIAYFAGRDIHPDLVFGMMAREFLPSILPGLLGIFIASLLASVMSSCDSFMIASSALFTQNIYKPMFKYRSEDHYLRTGRIVSIIIVIGGVLFAYQLPGVVKGLEIFWKIGPMLGIGFWLGLFWRGMTPVGVWAATIAGFFAWWLSEQAFFLDIVAQQSYAETLNILVYSDAISMSLPWQMVFYLVTGICVGILLSLITPTVSPKKLDNFYNLIKTPVTQKEGTPEYSCTLPEGVTPADKKRVFPGAKSLELYVPSRISIIGFFVTVAAVLLLIYTFIYITQ